MYLRALTNLFGKLSLGKHQHVVSPTQNLFTSSQLLVSDSDIRRRGTKIRKSQIPTMEGTVGAESWLSVDTSNIDQHLPTVETFKQRFNGILYEELPIVYIKATKNNTIIHVNDYKYNKITYTSCRMEGFLNARKKTTIAGTTTGVAAGQRLLRRGIRTVRVQVRGIGPGRMTSVKGLAMAGIEIVSISDFTPLVELGPRPRKIRRV